LGIASLPWDIKTTRTAALYPDPSISPTTGYRSLLHLPPREALGLPWGCLTDDPCRMSQSRPSPKAGARGRKQMAGVGLLLTLAGLLRYRLVKLE